MTEPTQIKGFNPIKLNRFQPAEYQRVIYSATPEANTPVADLKKPEYWAHIAQQLKSGDRIEVEREDGAYFIELLVREVGRTWAKVVSLREITLEDTAFTIPEELKEYDVEYKGKITKWSVIRIKDRSAVYEGGSTKQDAVNWLTDHLKALAA